jgi:hypothetical protein
VTKKKSFITSTTEDIIEGSNQEATNQPDEVTNGMKRFSLSMTLAEISWSVCD